MASARKTERMVELAGQIARREQEIARMKAELRSLAGEAEPDDGVRPAEPRALTERILSVIDSASTPLTAPQVVAALNGDAAVESVRTLLSKLHASGIVARASHGRYCSWAVFPEGGRRPEGK